MKTFLKWHVPVAACWQAERGGAGPDPCLSPKYPNYVPFLAAKPQQCLPSPLRPRTRGLRGDRPAARAPRRHRCQGRSSAAWRAPVGAGHGWHVLPGLPTALAGLAATPRATLQGGCPLGGEGQLALPVLLGIGLPLATVARSERPVLLAMELAGRLGIRSQASV